MNLLEFNDRLMVNKSRKVVTVPIVTQEDCDLFRSLVSTSKTVSDMYEATDDATAFFTAFPDIKKIIGTQKCVEVFYACKLTYVCDGVPCRLVYIVNKMFNESGRVTVNLAINRALNLLKKYVDDVYIIEGKEYTVKDVIENAAGFSVKLLTSSVPKVKATNCYEVYVANAERVALIPLDIAKMLPYDECEGIYFDRQLGLLMKNGTPLRCLNDRMGITRDDFNLVDCL